MSRRRVNAEVCPGCESTRIVDHPNQAGLFGCADCGRALARVKRNSVFGDQYTYVDPTATRPGSKVYKTDADGKPRGSSRQEE